MGFPFFKPIYSNKTIDQDVRVRLHAAVHREGPLQIHDRSLLPRRFQPDPGHDRSADGLRGAVQIGPVLVTPIQLSHPNQGIGYKFVEDNKSFVFLTDNELALRHSGGGDYSDYLALRRGADLLVHDSEYTAEQYKITKGWGHSVYTDALRLAMEAGAGQFGLFHHNQERSDADQDRIVDDCRSIAARENVKLACYGMEAGMEITV